MSWTRLDDGFDEHGKILGFGDGAKGDARRYIWIRVLLYTNRRGHASVPWNVGETIPRASRGFLRDCVTLGLLDEDADELTVHDWPLYADVTVAEKVAYCLSRNADSSANEIARQVGGRRNEALAEIKSQRGTPEPPKLVSGNHTGNQVGGTRSGTHATGIPDPTRPDPKDHASDVSEISSVGLTQAQGQTFAHAENQTRATIAASLDTRTEPR